MLSVLLFPHCHFRGLFNPAVSLGMLLVGALTPLRAALLVVSQILGGIVGAAIIQVSGKAKLEMMKKISL